MAADTMSITAVVLSAHEYPRQWMGLRVDVHRQEIVDALGLLEARFKAVEAVETSHFFFLDDDDDLPPDYLDVLDKCVRRDAPICYTDEHITLDDGSTTATSRGSYTREAHKKDVQLIHHLALCNTAAAKESVARLPRGHLCPELLLYWDMARDGAAYVPCVGYHWYRRKRGMHAWPCTTVSQMRAFLFNIGRLAA